MSDPEMDAPYPKQLQADAKEPCNLSTAKKYYVHHFVGDYSGYWEGPHAIVCCLGILFFTIMTLTSASATEVSG